MNAGITSAGLYVTSGATFDGVVVANAGLTATVANVTQTINIPFQSVGNTAQRVNIGVYGTMSETASSAAFIIGNAIAASKQSLQKVEKTSFDEGQFIRMRYNVGMSFHTGVTGNANTEYPETVNTRMLVDLNGNVGINTAVPSSKLDVVGGISGSNLYISGGSTFIGNIFAPNIVNSVNGLTGAVGIVAGTNVTITPSGNTLTISASSGGSGGGAAGSTITTIDFSQLVNQIELVIYGNGGDFASSLQNIEQYGVENTTVTVDTGSSNYTTCALESIESFNDDTNGWSARIVIKPPFVGGTSTTAEGVIGETVSTVYVNNSVVNDYWNGIQSIRLLHKEETYAVKTITGQSWVAADTFITCKVLGLTSDDHDAEDAILEGVRFEINNIVAATGFDLIGHAPEGTYGKYKIECLGF
jgi:hypothetical protein